MKLRVPATETMGSGWTGDRAAVPRRTWSFGRRTVSEKARSAWLRQLSFLMRAGVTLDNALRNAALAGPPRWPDAALGHLAQLRQEIESGAPLARAMKHQPGLFDTFTVEVVAAGELTGRLDDALDRAAKHLDRNAEVLHRVRRALAYPAIVSIVALGTVTALLLFVIPVFAEVFSEFGHDLPLATRIVLAISDQASRLAPWLGGMAVLCVGLTPLAIHNPRARRLANILVHRSPVVGTIVLTSALANAAETLASLVSGGIPLHEALAVAERSTASAPVAGTLARAGRRIGRGSSLTQALTGDPWVFPTVVQLVAVGEESGQLADTLDELATLLHADANDRIDRLLSLLEPSLVLALACVVGGVVIAMYFPIFRVGAVLG